MKTKMHKISLLSQINVGPCMDTSVPGPSSARTGCLSLPADKPAAPAFPRAALAWRDA